MRAGRPALCYATRSPKNGSPDRAPCRAETMAGLDASTPHPTEIKLHQTSRALEIAFNDGRSFRLPYEFLRVHSPSAEVRGHGPGGRRAR